MKHEYMNVQWIGEACEIPYCPSCGKEVSQGTGFFPSCGTRIPSQRDAATQYFPQSPNESSPRQQFPSYLKGIATVAAIVVLVAIIAGNLNHPETIVRSGTVYLLNPVSYTYISFSIATAMTINGAFTTTNGAAFYTMTTSPVCQILFIRKSNLISLHSRHSE